jgi:transposase
MGNYLQMGSQQHIRALLELGWSQRRIAREAGVHRETVARYAQRLPELGTGTAGAGSGCRSAHGRRLPAPAGC